MKVKPLYDIARVLLVIFATAAVVEAVQGVRGGYVPRSLIPLTVLTLAMSWAVALWRIKQ